MNEMIMPYVDSCTGMNILAKGEQGLLEDKSMPRRKLLF